MGKGTFTVIVNQTENKAKPAGCDSQFLIPGFPASKLRAEKLVLSSYGRRLSNGEGKVIISSEKIAEKKLCSVLKVEKEILHSIYFFLYCYEVLSLKSKVDFRSI